jgi:hypothetical protein
MAVASAAPAGFAIKRSPIHCPAAFAANLAQGEMFQLLIQREERAPGQRVT